MDAYEKLFLKMEAKKKLAEKGEAKKESSDITGEEEKPSVNMDDKEGPLEETENSPWLPFWQTTFHQLAEEEETNKEFRKKLRKFTGSIYIKSKPSKAIIYLDGEEIGTTPATLKAIDIGPHEIEIKTEGHIPWRKSININKGKNKKIIAILQIKTGPASITREPPNTKAMIDGNKVGNTPVPITDLKPGKKTTLVHKLQMKVGSIRIESEPADALVLIDNKEVGNTPITITDLKPAMHNVDIRKIGHVNWSKNIYILPEKEVVLTAELKIKSGSVSIKNEPSVAIGLLENKKSEKKLNEQLEVFKSPKDTRTNEIILNIGVKEGQLRSQALVVDYKLDKNSFKDEILIMNKKAGVDYIIAPDFTKDYYKKSANIGLHLIKCSDARLIEKGNNIEVHLRDGVILDIDNGQEYKFKIKTDIAQRSTVHKTRLGECLLIGDNLSVKIIDIDKDQIKICINALKVVTIHLHKNTTIGDGIKIGVLKTNLDRVNLAIEAPEGIIINRE